MIQSKLKFKIKSGLALMGLAILLLPNPASAIDLPDAVKQLQQQFEAGQAQKKGNAGLEDNSPTVQNSQDIETILGSEEAEEEAPTLEPRVMEDRSHAILRALDKITGRTQTFDLALDEIVKFGSLFIRVRSCQKAPPIETPEAAAFVQIWEKKPGYDPVWIFSNWMFASSPALSAMEHPVYDIWVMDCKNLDKSSSSEENESQAETQEE